MLVKEIVEIKKGIQVFCDANTDQHSSRIWLSSGTTQEIESASDIIYRTDAFLPREPWREPSLTEYSLLRANEPILNLSSWDLGSSIGVVRFPNEVLAPLEAILENIRKSSAATLEECQFLDTHPERENAIAKVMKHVERYCLSSNRLQLLGIQTTLPGLTTVTSGYHNSIPKKRYDGMHLDSWDRDTLRRRHKSRNRICINLGCEERYFLFINLTLMDMFHALGLSDPEDIYKNYRGTSIGDKFMKSYPSYPVVKLKVAPGEAYIAPTENVIHDASTISKKYSDITLTFLGYFGILPYAKDGILDCVMT
nr:hypothetical protein [Hassalia byssoidea]